MGISAQYSHYKGLSTQGEYTRYYRESDVDTQMRASINIYPSDFPSLNMGYYQQRLPYTKYDVQGVNIGSSYKFWKFDLSTNGSWSNSRFWSDDKDRSLFTFSVGMKYNITKTISLNGNYYQFWGYKSDKLSNIQRQLSFELQQCVAKKHLIGIGFKAVRYEDKNSVEDGYNENILLTKYQYSF